MGGGKRGRGTERTKVKLNACEKKVTKVIIIKVENINKAIQKEKQHSQNDSVFPQTKDMPIATEKTPPSLT